MKTLHLLITLTAGLTLTAAAAPKKSTTESPKSEEKPTASASAKPAMEEPKAKKNTYPLYGAVVSCNSRTLTIKGGEGKEDRKFTFTAETVITKDDKPAATEDVQEGQWVGGLVEKATEGNDKIVKLNLSVKQKPVAKADSTELPKAGASKGQSKAKKGE
ncbi:MAG: hypothetical protein ACOYMN_03015 [Roseimicrobium sp.]